MNGRETQVDAGSALVGMIDRLGQETGLALQADDQGRYGFVVEGRLTVALAAEAGGEIVQLEAELARPPVALLDTMLRRAMLLNRQPDVTGGATIGLDGDSGVVTLTWRQQVADLDPGELAVTLAAFVERALAVQDELRQAAAGDGQAEPMPEEPVPAGPEMWVRG